jgi:membrane protease YdiL (CAAX protease family)
MFWPRSEGKNWFPKDIEYLSTKRGIVSMFLIVVICIPILEEIIYRGYVFTALSQNLNNIFLVFVLTSLIFASIHCLAGPGFMLYIFLGTLFCPFYIGNSEASIPVYSFILSIPLWEKLSFHF